VGAPLLIAEVTLRNFRLQKRTSKLHLLKPFAHPHPDSQNANPRGVRAKRHFGYRLRTYEVRSKAEHLGEGVSPNRMSAVVRVR